MDSQLGRRPAPRQLPSPPRHFAGRSRETDSLTALVDRARPAPVVTIHGPAGIGKTALALWWAHQLADRYPDGQLFVNLQGYDPARAPVPAQEALAGLLDAVGTPITGRPADLAAQADLLRGVLAGRRVLVLLDNARTAEQVRPLLPAGDDCLVIVTSRHHLTGLAPGDPALAVGLLDEADARELLARHLGADLVAAQPAAVRQLIGYCGRLPLALSLVAARATGTADLPDLARQLSRPMLAQPEGEKIRAAFSWSYQALAEPAQRMFRLLSCHPGGGFTSYAAASVTGVAMAQARLVLQDLTRAHMLEQTEPGEYGYHDLLRSYADELAATLDPPGARRAALHRMLDHYVRTASSAAALLNTVREPVQLPQPQPGAVPQLLDDHDEALAWFSAKRSTLVMAVEVAAEHGFGGPAGDLSWALADFLDRQGHWNDLVRTQQLAYDSATGAKESDVRARASRILGRACTQLGRYDEALAHYQRACRLCVELADQVGEALAHLNLAYLQERLGRRDLALAEAERALELYQAAGHRVGQGRALNSVGWYHALLGHPKQALELCADALLVSEELADRHGEADALDSLGYAYLHAGEPLPAIRCYEQAISRYRQLGSRYAEAATLEYLADAHLYQGDHVAARVALRSAADILRQLGVPDLDRIEARLAEIPDTHR